MIFGISSSFWIYCVLWEVGSQSTSAYFGLTGRDHIPNVKTIDPESVFIGDDKRENVYQWNEKGYYTAPSKSYERIDLSPQPDDQKSPPETLPIKRTWQKRPRSTSDDMPKMNSRRQYPNDAGGTQVKPSSSTLSMHYRRHAEPRPDQPRTRLARYPQQIRRRPYNRQAYVRQPASRSRKILNTDSLQGDAHAERRSPNSLPLHRYQSKFRSQGRTTARKGFHTQSTASNTRFSQDTSMRTAFNRRQSSTESEQPGSSLPPEIRPLFVTDDISSIIDIANVDSSGQMKLESENIQPQTEMSKPTVVSDIKPRTTSIPLLPVENIKRRYARKQCDGLSLTKKQRRLCKKDSGLPQILGEAMFMSTSECQYQFRHERWNCDIGRTRVHLISRGNKETAFLFAISSAGLVHSVARGCAKGYLERCSCDETYADHVNQEAWMWGGCGDNVQIAAKFVRQFLKPKSRSEDIRAEVDKHNSDLGIRMVRHSVTKICKCHGVSGSCTTKTCWRKVDPFYQIGRKLKNAYIKSVKVGSINSAGGKTQLVKLKRTRRNRPEIPRQTTWNTETDSDSRSLAMKTFVSSNEKTEKRETVVRHRNSTILRKQDDFHNLETNPRHNELVYLENSPQYCRRTRYSLGTKGRVCDQHNCKDICCGRGYTTKVHSVHRSCECEVRWCCYVECKTCLEKIEVHTCN